MMTFHGGPADGVTLPIRRAPYYLRVVVSEKNGLDALDQLSDVAAEDERIYVYVRPGEADPVHVRGDTRATSGTYWMGTYVFLPDVDGEALRDTAAWQAWVMEQPLGAGQGRIGERTWPPPAQRQKGGPVDV